MNLCGKIINNKILFNPVYFKTKREEKGRKIKETKGEMQSGPDRPGSGLKSVRRSPRLSPESSAGLGKELRKGGSSLQEVKRKGRMERSREEELNNSLKKLDLSCRSAVDGTGLVFSDIFTHHKNLWAQSCGESRQSDVHHEGAADSGASVSLCHSEAQRSNRRRAAPRPHETVCGRDEVDSDDVRE
ncbi:hypothetical protein JOB18_028528 [Solea senegalensis]|uniref:Uncharacterized protein n=1 Tax=Solea senegalensis TaxID=28829 RepID=A0AAV6SSG9_SOLSE|nr:hypothetical protein JOB18_028528 [Solea senegalensis]